MTIYWVFGLSGAGKSRLAEEFIAFKNTGPEYWHHLDGDELRGGICADLGFTTEDRRENLRRAAHIAKLYTKKDVNVIATFMTPTKEDREMIREILPNVQFFFCEADIETCQARDVKGLYALYHKGNIDNVSGLDSPFDIPNDDTIWVNTSSILPKDSLKQMLNYEEKYAIFIGRWCPIHDGHKKLIKTVCKEKGLQPLILLRDTVEEISTYDRGRLIWDWLKEEFNAGQMQIIPDIKGVYYGRKVGYEVEEIVLDEETQKISGTKIRKEMGL